jgi:hypothetical protein
MSSVHTSSSLRATPDNNNKINTQNDSDDDKPLKIKRELPDESDDKQNNLKRAVRKAVTATMRIKSESNEGDEDGNNLRNSSRESANQNNETEDEDDKPLKLIKANALMNNQNSPRVSPSSPMSDNHSTTSRSTPNDTSANKKSIGAGSLGALSSMFDNLGNVDKPSQSENGQQKRSKAHPLAALQKLCDKNENTTNSRSNSASLALAASPSLRSNNQAGAILAFSWACNDGISVDDSNIKCAFCDTSFTSKGAYRHHLSKVHFVNDDMLSEAVALKTNSSKLPPPSRSPKSPVSISPKSNVSVEMGRGNGMALLKKSPSPVGAQSSNERHNKSDLSVGTSSSSSAFDESPHSKFLKYTELAKQLSSKYV